jgi:hypothetical protein
MEKRDATLFEAKINMKRVASCSVEKGYLKDKRYVISLG